MSTETKHEPYVGGRILLEAGDAVEVYQRDRSGETVYVGRARVKHSRADEGQSIWQTPLAIYLDTPR